MLVRLGRRSAAHPLRSLAALGLFILVAGYFGGPVAGKLDAKGGFAPEGSPSSLAERQLAAATGQDASPGILIVVAGAGGGGKASPPTGLDARARAVAQRLGRIDGIASTQGPAARSSDGAQALVTGTLDAAVDDDDVAQRVLDAFGPAKDLTVGGDAVAGRQIGDTVSADLGRAELLSFPLLLLLSLVFFRGRAALMPLVVGVTTVLGTFLVLLGVNELYGLNVFALNLVIGLGLGLAIDYTLFLVTRFREQLAHGDDVDGAIARTMATAGRTVAFSATTVACALATLTVFPLGFAKSMGLAGATVAIVAAVASLAVSPALLARWGHGLAWPHAGEPSTRWHTFAHAVMRRPGTVAAATAAVMLLAASPALRVSWSPVDATAVPTDKSARSVSDTLERDFGGRSAAPITVVTTAGASARASLDAYARRARGLDGVTGVGRPAYLGHTTWTFAVRTRGDAASPEAQRLVRDLRRSSGRFTTRVAGPAAEFVDQQAAIGSRLLLAGVLLAALTFLVLFAMTGSVVLPLKALVMNALTVGAALAPLVLIYQAGRFTGLLGYTPNGGVEPTDFLVTAAIVFALSTDYGVFLLGRIKEARDAGASDREAVAAGVAGTGRVVTAAAVLLAVAIGAFSTSSISFVQQIGIATATGVLIDAFVVRSLLVPSLMALLGRWNWWGPRGLGVPGPRRPAEAQRA